VRRIVWIALGIVILSVWVCQPASAQDDQGLTMSVSAGFDGYCRSNAWCPVHVVLSNEGADVEGELRVSLDGDVNPAAYIRRVTLPAQSRKSYFFHLPLYDLPSRPKVVVQLWAGRKIVVSRSVTTILLEEDEQLYGIVSAAPSDLAFLGTIAPVARKAVVAQLDLESLSPVPLSWEGLDVLVLNDVDTTVLSGEQKQALATWVAHGGHLVVGGGAGAARTAAGLSNLLSASIDGIRSVDDLWALGELVGVSVAPGPYAIAEATLRDGEVLVEQEGAVLVARRTVGVGNVTFLAFDAGVNPFVDWDDNVRLWQWLVGGFFSQQRPTIQNGYQAREAVNTIPGIKHPSILQILGFLLIYVILIGPVNYVVLRKLDRRELAWITIPVLVLGFSACAYVTGFQLRGFDAIVHRLVVVYVPQEVQIGRVSQLVGLFSPRRTNYDVWMEGMEVRAFSGGYYYDAPSGRPLHVYREAEGVTVTDLRVDVGGIEPFIAEGYADVPGVDSDLRLVKPASSLRLQGSIRPQIPLEDAVLLVGVQVKQLGDLEAGQEVIVREPFNGSAVIAAGLSDRVLGTAAYWDDPFLYRRYHFLGAVFDPYYGPYGMGTPSRVGLGSGVYLLGWSDEQIPLSAEVVNWPYSALGTALYIYALPVAEAEADTMSIIPPELISREMVDVVGYVEELPEGFYMEFESEATFRFTLWGTEVPEVEEIVLNMREGYDYAYPPSVSIWDWESEDWRPVGGVAWGQYSIPNGWRYVSSSGVVLLRFKAAATGTTIERLEIAIKGK
jgi:hypothetical protein